MNKRTAVIIGTSHAAAQLTISLRQEGWDGDIVMIGDEPFWPYHRPPLSKTFLSGDKSINDLLIRPTALYDKQNIQFRQGLVTAIDRNQKKLTLLDGSTQHYDKLALCTGARARKIDIPGSQLSGVHYLRNISDVQGIQAHIGTAKNAVIIGGGYIGLETAASLKKQGISVVVLEVADRILQRVTAPELSTFYSRIHTEEGVKIYTGVTIKAIVGTTCVESVSCGQGMTFPADLVVIGVGVIPNVELAIAADIEVDNGIIVDDYCRTNDPNIVAAGDCTNHFNAHYNRRIRLESVPNASEQAKSAAAMICGIEKAYHSLPWFWSDQYDLRLQIAGLSHGYDHLIIRGNIQEGRSFAAFYLQKGHLIAADCVNRPQEFMLSKRIIEKKLTIDPSLLANELMPVNLLL
ncbi:MAG: NAD(P)/FAD-dependent oxidoreductase [Gammaproteobacteria bacterium]|nr:NAD(P)/FAD-dependent oxidoreductase [Gammaproteobacteria bacterium]